MGLQDKWGCKVRVVLVEIIACIADVVLRRMTYPLISKSAYGDITHPSVRGYAYFFLGFIRFHILHHASIEPIFGLDMIRELETHGYSLSPGTLYPILHGLEQDGFLESQ